MANGLVFHHNLCIPNRDSSKCFPLAREKPQDQVGRNWHTFPGLRSKREHWKPPDLLWEKHPRAGKCGEPGPSASQRSHSVRRTHVHQRRFRGTLQDLCPSWQGSRSWSQKCRYDAWQERIPWNYCIFWLPPFFLKKRIFVSVLVLHHCRGFLALSRLD